MKKDFVSKTFSFSVPWTQIVDNFYDLRKQSQTGEVKCHKNAQTVDLLDYKHLLSDSPNRTVKQPIKIKHFIPLVNKL